MPRAEDEIYARLDVSAVRSIVAERLYPGRAPQDPLPPFVVWRRISGQGMVALSGPLGADSGRFQVDCYANDHSTVVALAAAVRVAVQGGAPRGMWAECISEIDLQEPEIPALHRRSIDFRTLYTQGD